MPVIRWLFAATFDRVCVSAMQRSSGLGPRKGAGTFEARLNLTGKWSEPLVAGMDCDVKLVPYKKADAIAAPAKTVFTDELDETQRYVFVVKEGKPAKQPVKVGRASGERLEITEGLKAGDEILLDKPAE